MEHIVMQGGGFGGGIFEILTNVVALVGTLVLLLVLVAMGGIAYRHFAGGGITWPDDVDEDEEEGVRRNPGDDEWKFS